MSNAIAGVLERSENLSSILDVVCKGDGDDYDSTWDDHDYQDNYQDR